MPRLLRAVGQGSYTEVEVLLRAHCLLMHEACTREPKVVAGLHRRTGYRGPGQGWVAWWPQEMGPSTQTEAATGEGRQRCAASHCRQHACAACCVPRAV